MSDDFTTNAANPDMAADDAATQHIHERLLSLGTQWRSRHVRTDRLAAHVRALATRDQRTMPMDGYPLQQKEFVLTDMPQATRLPPRRYVISAVAAVVVIALLGAAFLAVTRRSPETRLPTATLTLPAATAAFTQTTTQSFTATVAAPLNTHPLSSLHMVDATTGWTQTDQQILRTSDGGTRWQNVTPPGITFPLPTQQKLIYTALDATTAWASDGKTIYRTTNAGQAWQSTAPPVEKSISYLTFVDEVHGWAVDFLGVGLSHSYLNLLRTTDGGVTWTRVTTTDGPGGLPSAGSKSGPVFITATTGWVVGSEPADNFIYFYVTHNGGVTWQQQSLPRPVTQSFQMDVGTPTFFSAQDGALPVSVSLAPAYSTGSNYIYVTHDGGVSWHIVTGTEPGGFGAPYFFDGTHWWVIGGQNGNDLAYTGDGGQHWTTITANGAGGVGTFDAVSQIDFTSLTTGWATTGGITGLPATLLHTTDGGHTWQQISYQVG